MAGVSVLCPSTHLLSSKRGTTGAHLFLFLIQLFDQRSTNEVLHAWGDYIIILRSNRQGHNHKHKHGVSPIESSFACSPSPADPSIDGNSPQT